MKDTKKGSMKFEEWLREKPDRDDKLWIISRGEEGNLHDVIKFGTNKVSLKVDPEDFIIVPR
jgi:hypothetical protein